MKLSFPGRVLALLVVAVLVCTGEVDAKQENTAAESKHTMSTYEHSPSTFIRGGLMEAMTHSARGKGRAVTKGGVRKNKGTRSGTNKGWKSGNNRTGPNKSSNTGSGSNPSKNSAANTNNAEGTRKNGNNLRAEKREPKEPVTPAPTEKRVGNTYNFGLSLGFNFGGGKGDGK